MVMTSYYRQFYFSHVSNVEAIPAAVCNTADDSESVRLNLYLHTLSETHLQHAVVWQRVHQQAGCRSLQALPTHMLEVRARQRQNVGARGHVERERKERVVLRGH